MGNTSSASISGATTLDSYIGELGDITFEKTLNSSRFLKCVRGKHEDGQVIVKLFVKTGSFSLKQATEQMQMEKDLLMGITNTLSYQKVAETERAVYLIRQYIFSNLYDRISTRPFLETIEKRWIIFQLLSGLRDCHARGIHHGDIKTENILVTSWNWIYLTDFAFFKPTYLPENNPADFSYYFDTSFRRTCYLAPERFYGTSESKSGTVTDAMDIFSLGCVIAELFLDGSSLFDLSQLLKYKTGDYDPSKQIDRIEDSEIRALILQMISLNPDKRQTAEHYLARWERRIFPLYFSTFLHQYIALITEPLRYHVSIPTADMDDVLDRIYFEFDKVSFFLGFDDHEGKSSTAARRIPHFFAELSIPNYRRPHSTGHGRAGGEDGALIFLAIVLSGVRNASKATTRARTCTTILALSEHVSDEAKLDRIIPFLMSLLNDEAPEVRMNSLRSLVEVLALVTVLTPVNAFVFPEYVLPRLTAFTKDQNVMVRVAYANALSLIAQTATRYMDMAQALRAEGFLTLVEDSEANDAPSEEGNFTLLFDLGKKDQQTVINDHIVTLLTDTSSIVKRTLLESISELCQLFGYEKSNDVILSHLITYLNDKDWLLKASFFKNVLGLSRYLGIHAVEKYILPLLVQSLTDVEDLIVEMVLCAMTSLCQFRLIRPEIACNLISIVSKFLSHPNLWIQEAVTGYVVEATKDLTQADIYCIVRPQIRQYLRLEIGQLTAISILQALRRPLPVMILDYAFKWAAASPNSLFWQSSTKEREFSGNFSVIDNLKMTFELQPATSSHKKDGGRSGLSKPTIARSAEDEIHLGKLRALGMKPEDEWKLLALREYIWRVAYSRLELQKALLQTETSPSLHISPTTIFFDPVSESPDDLSKLKHASHDVQAILRDASLGHELTRSSRQHRAARPLPITSSYPRVAKAVEQSSKPGSTASIYKAAVAYKADPAHLQNAIGQVGGAALGGAIKRNLKSPGHRTSSMNLPGLSTKAQAEVKTTNTVVLGQVDHHCASVEPAVIQNTRRRLRDMRPNHSYAGSDENIINLLEKVYLQNYNETVDDFGIRIDKTTPKPLQKTIPWKNETTLVAHIHEHTAAINAVCISPDHLFFVTGSDDGTVKIWDCGKLERNVANRARITYRGLIGSKIKNLCFVQNSYCVVTSTDCGKIQILKVDCTYSTSVGTKYGTIQAVRRYDLPKGEQVTCMQHFVQDQASILLVATNLSRLLAIDVRTMSVMYILKNPTHHGTPTSFCTDSKNAWLMLGTSCGILDLWDLRFQLRVKSIGLPQGGPVHSLCLHPSRGRGRWVCVGAGTCGEVSVWNIEKSQCREVYRPVQSRRPKESEPANLHYIPWDVERHTPEELLSGVADEFSAASPSDRRLPEIRALATGVDASEAKNSGPYIVAASADHRIRVWDTNKIEQSSVISGQDQEEAKLVYTSSKAGFTIINEEEESKHASKRTKSRSQLLAGQQDRLLKNHMDAILDIAYLQWPYPMVISVDRSGVLKVTA